MSHPLPPTGQHCPLLRAPPHPDGPHRSKDRTETEAETQTLGGCPQGQSGGGQSPVVTVQSSRLGLRPPVYLGCTVHPPRSLAGNVGHKPGCSDPREQAGPQAGPPA